MPLTDPGGALAGTPLAGAALAGALAGGPDCGATAGCIPVWPGCTGGPDMGRFGGMTWFGGIA